MSQDTLDANKKLVRDYVAFNNAGDTGGCLALMTADFGLECHGMPPVGYTADRARIETVMGEVGNTLAEPLHITIDQMTAEEDRVAVQARSRARLVKGGVYENTYHFLFTLRDGRITRIDEYLCTYTMAKLMNATIWEDAPARS